MIRSVPNDAAELASRMVGPHVGLVEALSESLPEADDLPLSIYAGRLANTAAFAPVMVPREVSGAGLDRDTALMACLGEAAERYAAGLPGPQRIQWRRCDELPGASIEPSRFALFAPGQYRQTGFPFVRWTPESVIGWTEGRSLTHGHAAWLPATFVWQPYLHGVGEPLLAPGLTTGLACAPTWTAAVTAGLCEVIERDAVALAWLGQVAPRRIERLDRAASDNVIALQELLDRAAFRWELFDLTTDLGLPVAAVLMEGHSPVGSVVSFGSAAAGDRNRAWVKALIEAAHCRMYVKSLWRHDPAWQAGRRFEHVINFAEHARFYSAHPEHRGALDRWWNSPRTVDAAEVTPAIDVLDAEWLPRQVQHLAARGYEVLAVDVTTPDVSELGLCVARVVVPRLQPLHGHHGWPHLGGQRLGKLNDIFGHDVSPPRRLNPWPHPCA